MDEEKLKVMGLLEHVDELRSRIIKSVLALLGFFCVCYAFAPEILGYLRQPLIGVLPAGADSFYFTGPMDVFMAKVKLSFFSALVLSCPVWLFQVWRFLEPALYERERRYAIPFLISAVVLFVVGVAFCFYVMIPVALEYLIGLGNEMGAKPIVTISDYLSLVMLLMAGFGAVFETPVILVLLSLLGVIDSQMLRSNRRAVIVVIVILAAIITPTPDPVSQIAMAVPCWIMYEMSILLIIYLEKKRAREDEPAASAAPQSPQS